MKRNAVFAVVLMSLVGLGQARATNVAGGFQATMAVSASCKVVAQNLAFGTYSPTGANASTALTSQADITVTCTNGTTSAIVYLSKGRTTAYNICSSTTRDMQHTVYGDRLIYELTKDAPYGQVGAAGWGCTTGTGNTGGKEYGPFTTQLTKAYTVYGRIAAGQNTLRTGNYLDIVNVTVNF